MRPDGGTPIGTAMIAGKRALDATGLSRRHLLVISDGKNTDGYAPEAVAIAIGRRPEIERPSMYFVAFDTSANQFDDMKNNGVLLLEAADNRGLNQTLDTLLRGEILVER
jgi:Mg-chelatase subunit ChlD